MLECLQKTPPSVIIFCEKKQDVDDIQEYLLVKGVAAASIHGGQDQEERNQAIRLFKEMRQFDNMLRTKRPLVNNQDEDLQNLGK